MSRSSLIIDGVQDWPKCRWVLVPKGSKLRANTKQDQTSQPAGLLEKSPVTFIQFGQIHLTQVENATSVEGAAPDIN